LRDKITGKKQEVLGKENRVPSSSAATKMTMKGQNYLKFDITCTKMAIVKGQKRK
jgi:hypothetical protein